MSRSISNPALAAVVLALAAVVVGGGLFLSENVGLGSETGTDGSLTADWVSDTGRNVTGNHHVAVGGRVDGRPMVFAPVSGRTAQQGDGATDSDTGQDGGHDHGHADHEHRAGGCGLLALDGTDGEVRWTHRVPPANCTIHAVADPTLADVDGDGVREVLATSTERTLVAFDGETGAIELEYDLSAYGYSRPLVADLTGDGDREIVVVDVHANVYVVGNDGQERWTKRLPASYVWGQPQVEDFDGDGSAELAVALGNGQFYVLDGDGGVAWNRSVGAGDSVTWFTAGAVDDDAATELVTATSGGNVSVIDGEDGSFVWRENFGAYAAARAVGDGDGDGTAEVYVTARDGVLRAVSGPSGDVEWETTLATDDVQMMPPPVLGDVDGDGDTELVAASNDGRVAVVDPASGAVVASYERETPIWTNPTLADVDGDDSAEIVVMYGDGRVAVLSYETSDTD